MQVRTLISARAAWSLIAMASGLASTAAAQGVESRRPAQLGAVNLVSGEIRVGRRDPETLGVVSTGDRLADGDTITTGASGRAEILLQPGSYLRAGENSVLDWIDGSPESPRIGLVRGSLIIEALGSDDARAFVEVVTSRAVIQVERTGLYRIDAAADGATRVMTRRGQARAAHGADEPTLTVRSGQIATFDGGTPEVSRVSRDDRDLLDSWSAQRSESLASAAASQEMSSSYSSAASRRSGMGWGWVYVPSHGCHAYIPRPRLSVGFGWGWSGGFHHDSQHGSVFGGHHRASQWSHHGGHHGGHH